MLPEWTVVGFTGHRTLENPTVVEEAIRNTLDCLAASHGPLVAVSSIASGADTLFVESVCRKEIPFHVLLPFSRERFRQDFSAHDWNRAKRLLKDAVSVTELSPEATDNDSYANTGELTVDRADVVLAVWNGQPAEGKGGTGDIVNYAKKKSKPLIIINPTTGNVSDQTILKPLPRESMKLFTGDTRAAVENELSRLDADADKNARLSRYGFILIILFHMLATIIAVVALALFNEQPAREEIAHKAEMVLLGFAILLVFIHHKPHHHWIKARFSTEICRSFLAIWKFPRHEDSIPKIYVPEFEAFLQRQLYMWIHSQPPPLADQANAQYEGSIYADYVANRLQTQIEHYSDKQREAERRFRLCKGTAYLGSLTAFFCACALVWHSDHSSTQNFLKALSIALPVFSASLLSLVVSNDFARRTMRYSQMKMRLEEVRHRLVTTNDNERRTRIVREAEQILLQEVAEWYSGARVAGESH